MAELLEYKCPCCGGIINFDINTQKMLCPYCTTSFNMEDLKANDDELNNQREESMEWNKSNQENWDEKADSNFKSYECNSCGAEIISEETTAASDCPYCGSTIVMKNNFAGMLKPKLLIPFKVDRNVAKENLMKHLKGKFLLPKVFKDENHIDEIKGLYVPFWLFDCEVDADITFSGTKVKTWTSGNNIYTKTSYYNLYRSGGVAFDDIPVDGSSKMDDAIMESIEPYDYSGAVDFQTAYLSGYLADKYDVTSDNCKERANSRVRNSTEEMFRNTIHNYSSVKTEKSSIIFKKSAVDYAMLPVWMLRTSWNGKNYIFAMNGQTGKMVGDLPLDKTKLFLLATSIGLGIAGITALIMCLL